MKDKISVTQTLLNLAAGIHHESNSFLYLKLSMMKSCIRLIEKGYIHEDYSEIIKTYSSAEAAPEVSK